MTTNEPIYRMVREIRDANLSPVDREMLRPAFAALDGGPVFALPERVIARVRDIHARMPKSK